MTTGELQDRMQEAMTQAHELARCNLRALPAIGASGVTETWLDSKFRHDRLHKIHPLAQLLAFPTQVVARRLKRLDGAIRNLREAAVEGLDACLKIMRKSPEEFPGVLAQLRVADYLLRSSRDRLAAYLFAPNVKVRLEPRIPASSRVSDIHVSADTLREDLWIEVYTPEEVGCAYRLEASFDAWHYQHGMADTLGAFRLQLELPTMVCGTEGVYDELFECGDEFVASRPSVSQRRTIWEGPSNVRLLAEPDPPVREYTRPWGCTAPLCAPVPARLKELVRSSAAGKLEKGQFCVPGKPVLAVNCPLTSVDAQRACFDPHFPANLPWSDFGIPADVREACLFFFYPDQEEPCWRVLTPPGVPGGAGGPCRA